MSTAQLPEAVVRVCRDHFESSPSTEKILWFGGDGAEEPMRLLELDRESLPRDGVWAFHFGRSDEYPGVWVAIVSTEEWAKVKAGAEGWSLPAGWALGNQLEIPRSEVMEEAA